MTNKALINNVVEVAVRRNISAWKPGQARQDFESTASTWGQLKRELAEKGFSLNDVRVTEGNTQIDLVNDDALLPTNIQRQGRVTNDLVIIMTPQTKIKSGVINPKTASYKEMKAVVKELFSKYDSAKAHFGNYTQMSTENMRKYLTSWYKKSNPTKVEANKFNKVKENLEKKTYEKVSTESSFNEEEYQEGLRYIIHGINILQNNTFDKISHNLPTDDEIEMMYKKAIF